MTSADYTDDVTLLTNSLTQAESLLQSLTKATAGISLNMNTNNIEYMCFKERAISTLSGKASKISKQVIIPQQQQLKVILSFA